LIALEHLMIREGVRVSTGSRKGPIVAIILGVLIALVHVTLGLTGVMTTAQWVSGVAVGLVVAGLGNHRRVFGHR
jgi:hypothetical protein